MNTPTQTPNPNAVPVKTPARRRYAQERMMAILALGFVAGVAMLTFFPEGPARGVGMTVYSVGLIWVLLKFGV
jgi:hypothetical protein